MFRTRLFLSAAVTLLCAVAAAFGTTSTPAATSSVYGGVVDVNTSLAFQGAAAAGTGIVLTPSGDVLTNNHVIRGATTVRVTDPTSGRSYAATVAGYDLPHDIALLRLKAASGLQTALLGRSAAVRMGDRVTAVGNAGGAGGLPTVTRGKVTALHQAITVQDDQGEAQRLSGLIEISARLQPGDSGGPLLNTSRRVIGVDAAASSDFVFQRTGSSQGYAIPIDRALTIAQRIGAGRASGTIHVGPTAFLGVELADPADDSRPGALVDNVLPSSSAAKAGLSGGDLLTSFAGHAVTSPTSLRGWLLQAKPGTTVQLRWLDTFGNSRSAKIRLQAGPPQ